MSSNLFNRSNLELSNQGAASPPGEEVEEEDEEEEGEGDDKDDEEDEEEEDAKGDAAGIGVSAGWAGEGGDLGAGGVAFDFDVDDAGVDEDDEVAEGEEAGGLASIAVLPCTGSMARLSSCSCCLFFL